MHGLGCQWDREAGDVIGNRHLEAASVGAAEGTAEDDHQLEGAAVEGVTRGEGQGARGRGVGEVGE
jgi:hypothetical protein